MTVRLDRLKVLIVDDNKHTRVLLAQILRALGITQALLYHLVRVEKRHIQPTRQ